MKKLFIFIAVLLCLFAMGNVASADDGMTNYISGRVFTVGGCTVSFEQGPFGPGEGGIAYIDCGPCAESAEAKYQYNTPVLKLYDDTGAINFTYAMGDLYLEDRSGLVLKGDTPEPYH